MSDNCCQLRGVNNLGVEYFDFCFDSAGSSAVETTTIVGNGVVTVVRTTTGIFHATIDRSSYKVLGIRVDVEALQDGSALMLAQGCVVTATGDTSIDDTADPIIVRIATGTATGTLADPASGRKVSCQLALKRSSIG